MAQVVVVGAGVAGLAAAVYLADLGHVVTVLEQSPSLGGSLGTFARDGYTFDTGEPTLTLPAVFSDLFRVTGRPLERELGLVPVEPRVIRSPADRERETRVPGGAVGGLTLTGLRSTWQRPGDRSPIQGLYLVGAATHPGPGLAFAARSATITADLIGRAI